MTAILHELIIFDLGGVVVDVESDRLVQQVAGLLGRSFDDVQAAIYHQELLLPFELGRITPHQYFEGLKQRLKLPWTYEQFARAWNDVFRENVEVTQIAGRLHKRYKLVALSNTNVLHLAHIRATVPSLSVISEWVASCDVGMRKPDPKFYLHALDRFRIRPDRAVYIDDRPEMADAGRSVGLRAIRFENSRQLEQDLQSLGLNL